MAVSFASASSENLNLADPLDPGGAFSFRLLVKIDDVTQSGDQTLVGKTDFGQAKRSWQVFFNGGSNRLEVTAYPDGASIDLRYFFPITAFSSGTWHDVVVAYDTDGSAGSKAFVWVDGTELTATSTPADTGLSAPFSNDVPVMLGSTRSNGSYGNFLDGDVAEFSLWDGATFGQAEADYLYAGGMHRSGKLLRPDILSLHSPLVRDPWHEQILGTNWSENGTPDVAAHPSVLNAMPMAFAPSPASAVGGDTNISANVEALTLTTNAASIANDVNVSAGTEALTLTTNAASVSNDVDISANVEALTLTTYPATIAAGTNVLADVEALTLTTNQATITTDVNVAAGPEALTLTTYRAGVSNQALSDRPGGGFLPTIYLDEDGNEVDLDAVAEAVDAVQESAQPTKAASVQRVSGRVLAALRANERPRQPDVRKLRAVLAEKQAALTALNAAIEAQQREDDEVTVLLLAS